MKIKITESQYKVLNEQLYKLFKKSSSSEPKIVKGVSKITSNSAKSTLKNLIVNYIQKFGEEEFIKLRKSLLNKEISKEEFFNTLRTNSKFNLSKIDLSTKVGIKFSEKENQLINKISNDLIGKTYDQLKNMNLTLPLIRDGKTINTKIIPVNKEWVSKNMPDKIKDEMWVDGDEIYIFMDNIKGYDKNRMVTIIQHEATHIKDPSLTKSPKLQKSYPKPEWFKKTEPWTDEWIEKYYTHPFETNAINSQFFNHMSVMVKSKLNKVGKDEIIKSLDQIINYTKGFSPTWSDLSLEILGYSGKNAKNEIVNHFNILNEKNPIIFKKLMKDLSIQSLKLKNELSRIK